MPPTNDPFVRLFDNGSFNKGVLLVLLVFELEVKFVVGRLEEFDRFWFETAACAMFFGSVPGVDEELEEVVVDVGFSGIPTNG